ncbi:hypothetical protein SAMN05428981_101821 [Bacillus sp. OV194]|nr:hypothetical protein SAMN05428981_101821 [Bacillus sp. OV194]
MGRLPNLPKNPASPDFISYIYEGTERSTPVYQNGNTAAGTVSFEANYTQPNDKTQRKQTVTAVNRLNKEVTLNIPVYMKPGSYSSTEGEITESKAYGLKQWMEVKVTVPANSSKDVTIQPK